MSGSAALLIVNYGSHELVAENVAKTALPDDAMVIVVDNATTAVERHAMTALALSHGWVLLAPDTNLGFGGGMNLAADEAIARGAETLVLLNPDAYIRDDGFMRLCESITARRALIAPIVIRPDGSHFSSEMQIDLADGRIRRRVDGGDYADPAVWISGACFAISVELWQAIGGFDDDYFLYWEDVDLSVRAASAGARIAVDERIVAVHSAGGTQHGRSGGKSATYYRFNARNRLVFAAKHVDRTTQRRWIATMPAAGWNVVIRGGRRQLLRPWASIWPVVRGSWDGWRFLRRARNDENTRRR